MTKKKSDRDIGLIQKKDKNGEIKWYARIVRTEPDGSKKQYTRKAENKTEARRLRDELAEQFRDGGHEIMEGDKVTFIEFAAKYKERKIIPPKYRHDRKVAGLRSYKAVSSVLDTLILNFAKKRLKDITRAEIERFKLNRLDTPIVIKRGDETIERPRSIAGVNRELALLRTMLNEAVSDGLLMRSPFSNSKLISLADEVKRDRVLSFDEESRLLAACLERDTLEYERYGKTIQADAESKRGHLRPILITALDTAMRAGELRSLVWDDVDLSNRSINLKAFNTKTARARTVGMTNRVYDELSKLWSESPKKKSCLVFGVKDNFKRAFLSACKKAKIENFKFHDCRHTAITRMVAAGLPHMEIMNVSGHTSMEAFSRYVNQNTESIARVADGLSTYYSERASIVVSDSVN